MNFNTNQRRLYLVSLAILVAAIALACTWGLWSRPTSTSVQPTRLPLRTTLPTTAPVPSAASSATPQTSGSGESAVRGGVDTVVYYQDNYGYLVPVMCSVPASEGIAKATLSLMVQSSANDM